MFLHIPRPPRSTLTDTLFPTRRCSDLAVPGPVPPGSAGQGSLEASNRVGQDEFSGLRSYQRGDTARAIHWKSLPKSPQPMVKQFQETLDQDLWLEWNRSEEHTSELQSLMRISYAVFCLKKKIKAVERNSLLTT